MSEFDASSSSCRFAEAQLYFNLEGAAQSIEIFVDNPDDVDALRRRSRRRPSGRSILTDWRQRNQTFFAALRSSATSCS